MAGGENRDGLMAKLEQEWERRHGIYKDEKADPIAGRRSRESNHVFQPKPCARIGFCVCELPGQAAFCLWQKLSQKLKTCFPDKSSAKAKLDAGMAILMFEVPESPEAPELDDAHPKSRFWFHLGYINKKTYHFTLLRMAERGPQIGDVQPLRLAGHQEGIATDSSLFGLAIHVFATLFELDSPLSVTLCYLVQRPTRLLHLSEMQPHHVEVHVSSGTPDFTWSGWELEKPRRKRKRKGQGQDKKKEQEGHAHPKRSRGPRGPKVKKDRFDEAVEAIADENDDSQSGSDSIPASETPGSGYSPSIAPADPDVDSDYADPDLDALFAQLASDDDDEINIFASANENPVLQEAGQMLDMVGLPELDIGFAEPNATENLGHGPDHVVPSAEPAIQDESVEIVPTDLTSRFDAVNTHETLAAAPENVDLAMAADKSVQGADVDVGEKSVEELERHTDKSSSVCTDDISISELSVHLDDDDSSSSSSIPSSDDSNAPGPRAGHPKKKAGRKPLAAPRAPRIVDQRFDITNLGSIRYNMRSSTLVAFCPFHSDNCRRTRTCKSSTRNKDQGRPLGVLMAWLQAGPDFENQQTHSSECRPSFEARVSARADFVALDGGQDFSDSYERPVRSGEGPEPRNVS